MNKYSVKLILWKHTITKTDSLPIYLIITINRKPVYMATEHVCELKDWDELKQCVKSSNPNHKIINPDINSFKNKIFSKILELDVTNKLISSAQVKKIFKRNTDDNNIFDFLEVLIENVKEKRQKGTIKNYRNHLQKLKDFHGANLSFEDVNEDFLLKFEAWFKQNVKSRKEGDNYLNTVWKTIKTIFNEARKRKITENYPFTTYENPRYISPEKDYLSPEELKKWEDYIEIIKDNTTKQAAVYFLLGCYSGLRVSDWYEFNIREHVIGDKIRLRPKKTEKFGQWVEMIINKPLARNLERMKKIPLKVKDVTINEKLKIIAARLGIDKSITTHTGRHTFAVTVCLGNGIGSETAAELMGITLKTFIDNYSQVVQAKIDKETLEAWKSLK